VDIDDLANQWLELGTLPLSEIIPDFTEDIQALDSVKFWASVSNMRNAGGDRPFLKLADFALKALTIPISNAVIERVFSVLASIKTKPRNRIQLDTLEALLRIRVHLKV